MCVTTSSRLHRRAICQGGGVLCRTSPRIPETGHSRSALHSIRPLNGLPCNADAHPPSPSHGLPVFQHLAAIDTGTTIVTFLMVFLIQTPITAIPQRCISSSMSLSVSVRARATSYSIWKGLSESELEYLKGSFTKLADDAPDTAILRETAEDLDVAGAQGKGEGHRRRRPQGRKTASLAG